MCLKTEFCAYVAVALFDYFIYLFIFLFTRVFEDVKHVTEAELTPKPLALETNCNLPQITSSVMCVTTRLVISS